MLIGSNDDKKNSNLKLIKNDVYTLDAVYPPDVSQEDIYEAVGAQMV